jgi:hypothetical protein
LRTWSDYFGAKFEFRAILKSYRAAKMFSTLLGVLKPPFLNFQVLKATTMTSVSILQDLKTCNSQVDNPHTAPHTLFGSSLLNLKEI